MRRWRDLLEQPGPPWVTPSSRSASETFKPRRRPGGSRLSFSSPRDRSAAQSNCVSFTGVCNLVCAAYALWPFFALPALWPRLGTSRGCQDPCLSLLRIRQPLSALLLQVQLQPIPANCLESNGRGFSPVGATPNNSRRRGTGRPVVHERSGHGYGQPRQHSAVPAGSAGQCQGGLFSAGSGPNSFGGGQAIGAVSLVASGTSPAAGQGGPASSSALHTVGADADRVGTHEAAGPSDRGRGSHGSGRGRGSGHRQDRQHRSRDGGGYRGGDGMQGQERGPRGPRNGRDRYGLHRHSGPAGSQLQFMPSAAGPPFVQGPYGSFPGQGYYPAMDGHMYYPAAAFGMAGPSAQEQVLHLRGRCPSCIPCCSWPKMM